MASNRVHPVAYSKSLFIYLVAISWLLRACKSLIERHHLHQGTDMAMACQNVVAEAHNSLDSWDCSRRPHR